MNEQLDHLLDRANTLLNRIETLLPQPLQAPDWAAYTAFRYRKRAGHGCLQAIRQPHLIALNALCEVDAQRDKIVQNTRQFVSGAAANNVLLTGARGTGKSSLVKACLNEFASQGLRLIEVDKLDLVDLPDIVELLADRPERFIVFCDDLSFETGELGYKALKSVLDGSIAQTASNVVIYATSNRRHLLPEYLKENQDYQHQESGEVHPGEGVEEKISLSERFGLWVSFYPFTQDEYLAIVNQWLLSMGLPLEQIHLARSKALVWALERGSRNGRVAYQFAKDYTGMLANAPSHLVHVAVGVVFAPNGQFLMTTRPSGKPFAGYWEFPGGKIEPGESVQQALTRELDEELGIVALQVVPWRTLDAAYPHASVRLHICKVTQWTGTLEMREAQQFSWQQLPVSVDPVLSGSVPILDWLSHHL